MPRRFLEGSVGYAALRWALAFSQGGSMTTQSKPCSGQSAAKERLSLAMTQGHCLPLHDVVQRLAEVCCNQGEHALEQEQGKGMC